MYIHTDKKWRHILGKAPIFESKQKVNNILIGHFISYLETITFSPYHFGICNGKHRTK